MEKAVSWKKILIFAIAVCLFAGIIVKCNQFQKTPLASYKGQKYEKAVVTKIIKDNLAEDGSRYGTQKVLVKMTTGTYKGKEKQAINPSGTLFGADCKVGARIIVIVNKSGTNVGFTVYSQDRTMAISGAICGIAGFVIVSGASHTISTATAGGRGFTAIIVAWLSKFNTFIMVAVSFGIVFMNQGAVQIATQYGLNENASDVILGIILFFLIGAEFFINYRVKRTKK